jgi:hypothetical protein
MEDKTTKIKERVLKISDFKELKKEDFFTSLGVSYGNFKGKSKDTPLNSDTIADILTMFPDINPTWLLTGDGKMLKNEQNQASKNLIPFFLDVGSVGGSSMKVNESTSSQVEYIDAGDWFPNATAAIRHYGESMIEYPSGCILALREVKDLNFGFILGQNYVIEYGEDWNRVTKRIQKDGENFMAYSTNEDAYKDGSLIHQPFILKQIHRAWRVLGYVVKTESSTGVVQVSPGKA